MLGELSPVDSAGQAGAEGRAIRGAVAAIACAGHCARNRLSDDSAPNDPSHDPLGKPRPAVPLVLSPVLVLIDGEETVDIPHLATKHQVDAEGIALGSFIEDRELDPCIRRKPRRTCSPLGFLVTTGSGEDLRRSPATTS